MKHKMMYIIHPEDTGVLIEGDDYAETTIYGVDKLLEANGISDGDSFELSDSEIESDIVGHLFNYNKDNYFQAYNTESHRNILICTAELKRLFGKIPKKLYLKKL